MIYLEVDANFSIQGDGDAQQEAQKLELALKEFFRGYRAESGEVLGYSAKVNGMEVDEHFSKSRLMSEERTKDHTPIEFSPLAEKILTFIKSHKLQANHVIPVKPFRFNFFPTLDPVEQSNIEAALDELREASIIDENDKLTEQGFARIWK